MNSLTRTFFQPQIQSNKTNSIAHHYLFSSDNSNLSDATCHLVFQVMLILYNQVVREINNVHQRYDDEQLAMMISQIPFPTWTQALKLEPNGLSSALVSRLVLTRDTAVEHEDVCYALQIILMDSFEQVKREMSLLIAEGRKDRMRDFEFVWSTLNMAIYRVVRDL